MKLLLPIICILFFFASKVEAGRIHWAARSGDSVTVKDIVEKDPEAISERDSVKRTSLHYAAWSGHLNICQYLLAHGAPIDARQNDGRTPIFYAVLSHHPQIAQLFLEHGAHLDDRDTFGMTPYFQLGNIEVMEFVRTHGANLNIVDRSGHSILESAMRGKNYGMLQYLLSHGVNPNGLGKKDYIYTTPIYFAVERRDTEAIRILVKEGADISIIKPGLSLDSNFYNFLLREGAKVPLLEEPKGRSLLHNYADRWYWSPYVDQTPLPAHALELLLQNPNDVNAKNERGQTPLHLAAFMGNIELVEKLIEHGANVNVRDNDDATPLHYASGYDKYEFPKGVGICGNVYDSWPERLLHTKPGRLAVTAYLVSHGAKVSALDKENNIPLHWYIYDGCDSALKLMLPKHPKLTWVNDEDENLLHIFCGAATDSSSITTLIDAGIDINAQDKSRRTPLAAAIIGNNIVAVKTLISHGVQVNSTNKKIWSPLRLANHWGRTEIADILKSAGADW